MSNFASMRNHFNLGWSRACVVRAEERFRQIYEMGSDNRYVNFSIVRWASFVRAIDEAKNAIYDIHINPQLKFQNHVGGGYYITVSANFKCVDIR